MNMSKEEKMTRYGLSLSEAKKLQRWALKISGAKEILDKIPKYKYRNNKKGLCVDYEIDEFELTDDGFDYCTPEVASILAIDEKGEEIKLGCIRAYNWETYWLEINPDREVDTAENWWKLIQKEYENLSKETK